jgi:hypothetical protein
MTRKSRLFEDKIRELRAFFEQYEGRALHVKLFWLHRAIQKGLLIGPYSQAEIGKALYRDEQILERLRKAVGSGYTRLRKWRINRSQAPFPMVDENGYTVMVNMNRELYEAQTSPAYKKQINGTKANDRKFGDITSKSAKELEIMAKADEIAIEKEELRPLQGPEITIQRRKRKSRK